MGAQGFSKLRRRWPLLRRQAVLAVALVAGAGTLFAALPASQSFNVTVTLNAPTQSTTGQCGSTVETGSLPKVTVFCSPAPLMREAPRPLFHLYRDGEWLGTVDGQMGTGTVVSWRIVHVANREYLEMMVGW